MDDEPKRPVAMCLNELNSCEDDAMDHGFRPVFEADDMQVQCSQTLLITSDKGGGKRRRYMFLPMFVCLSVC